MLAYTCNFGLDYRKLSAHTFIILDPSTRPGCNLPLVPPSRMPCHDTKHWHTLFSGSWSKVVWQSAPEASAERLHGCLPDQLARTPGLPICPSLGGAAGTRSCFLFHVTMSRDRLKYVKWNYTGTKHTCSRKIEPISNIVDKKCEQQWLKMLHIHQQLAFARFAWICTQ